MRIPITGISIAVTEQALHIASVTPLTVLSSAVVGAELDTTHHILNWHVHKHYSSKNPADELRAAALTLGITTHFVGLMTAVKLERARCAVEHSNALTVAVVQTLGLSNATTAGISIPALLAVGTINTIILIDGNLMASARVNALLIATEAKTLALFEHNVRTHEGQLATGTSTDAIVIACTGRGEPLRYAGAATELDWLIGRTVRAVTQAGLTIQ